jgi:hypothetical protein
MSQPGFDRNLFVASLVKSHSPNGVQAFYSQHEADLMYVTSPEIIVTC